MGFARFVRSNAVSSIRLARPAPSSMLLLPWDMHGGASAQRLDLTPCRAHKQSGKHSGLARPVQVCTTAPW